MKLIQKKINLLSSILICVALVLSCNDNHLETKQFFYPNGAIKESVQLLGKKRSGLIIHYYENGNVKSLEKYVNDTINGEVFSFYSSGFLEKKSITRMGIPNGASNAFFPNGRLKEYRYWVNGKKQGFGEDYWESNGNIKAIYWARNDSLKYERMIDSLGYVLKTMGNVPVGENK